MTPSFFTDRRLIIFASKRHRQRDFKMFPSSECYTWIVVLMVESVAIVTVNVVTIVVFVKTRGLRRRSMHLVMNLAVAEDLLS